MATPFDTDFRAFLKLIGKWDVEPDWRYAIGRVTNDVNRVLELGREVRKEIMKFTTKELIKKSLR